MVQNKKRKHLTLDIKLDIIKRFESGERAVDTAKHLGVPPTTVRTIVKDKDKYKQYVKDAMPLECRGSKTRSIAMVQMEKRLLVWIEDQTQRSMPLSQMLIQQKALRLYEDIKKRLGESSDTEMFTASRG